MLLSASSAGSILGINWDMSNEINVSSEYGPKKFRALFERGLDIDLDRRLRRAEMKNVRLSGTEIR